MIDILKRKVNYFRSHLILKRKVSMFFNLNSNSFNKKKKSVLSSTKELNTLGYAEGPKCSPDVLKEINEIYLGRIKDVKPKTKGAPFVNLMKNTDINVNNPIIKLAFSKEILDPALDYFGYNLKFDSIQVLYSYTTNGEKRESQFWHKDYGDSKSFHCVMYLNDIEDVDGGPFVFVNKLDSKKINSSFFIRRIKDEDFKKELGNGEIKYFFAKAGESVFIDPASCYHYGSRCKESRLAIFFTFNTSTPYLKFPSITSNNKEKLLEIGKQLRPDITLKIFKKILDI